MNLTKKINLGNAHIYFFYLFLFSIPFQTRKVFLTEYSFYSGAFTEYATFFVYASDILLILALFFWLVFNKNLYSKINVLIHTLDFRLHGNNKCGIFQRFFNINKLSSIWLLLFIFISWLIISAIVSNNYIEISAFYILKFIELSLLIIYIYFNLRNKNRLITALFTISLAGFFQGLIAIYQFVYQCPLFKQPLLHKLTGESTVYPQLPGIAKIVIANEKLIRSYGTFPHPNLLGGFLILTIIITIYLFLEHKRDILSSIKLKLNLFYNTNNIKSQGYISSVFWIILIFTQITALFFTFSRTAWFGFLLSLFIISVFYFYNNKIVSRETICLNKIVKLVIVSLSNYNKFSELATLQPFNKFRINSAQGNRFATFHRFKELIIIILLTLILVIVYFPHMNNRMSEDLLVDNSLSLNYIPSNYALNDRIFYNNVSRETISENFVFGSGPGTFIFQINDYLAKNKAYQEFEPWQYQPAHNIYFLIASETGIVGLFIFLLFLGYIISNSFKTIKKPLNKRLFLDNIPIVSRETIGINKIVKNKIEIINLIKAKILSRLSSQSRILGISEVPRLRDVRKNIWDPVCFICVKIIRKTLFIDTFWIPAYAGMTRKFAGMTKSRKLFNELKNKLTNSKGDRIVSRETILDIKKLNYYLLAIFVSFLFIGLFDHYFWTLQQGRLIFWLVLGLILVNSKIISNKSKQE